MQPTPSPQSQPLGAVPPPLQPHPLGAPCSPTPVQLHPRGRQTQLHGSRTCCRATPPQSQPLGAGGPPTVTPPPGGAVQPNPCAATPPGAPDAAARQPDELPYNPSPNPNRWGRWAPHCNPTPWGSRAAQPLCSYTPWRRCVAQPLCSYNLQPHPATGFPCRRPARPNLFPLPILACQCQPDTGLPCLPYLFCMQKLFT